jgi:plastocyanin
MSRKKLIRRLAVGLAAAAGAVFVATASGHGTAATITIRHQTHGCHTWSFNNGPYKATQSIQLARGATLTVRNNDVMPHKLVRTSGPAVRILTPRMARMGATARIHFTKAGVYRFKTKAGEDYSWASHMKTTGEDNVLRLTVAVK